MSQYKTVQVEIPLFISAEILNEIDRLVSKRKRSEFITCYKCQRYEELSQKVQCFGGIVKYHILCKVDFSNLSDFLRGHMKRKERRQYARARQTP